MLKRFATVLAGAVGFAAAVPAAAHAAPVPDVTTAAAADAYVSEATPGVAEGTADPSNCNVNDDAGTAKWCLVSFTVTGLVPGDSVTGADLLINDKGNAAGSKLVNVSKVAAFSESAVTWATRPALGPVIGSQTSHLFGADSVFTLSPGAVTANGSVSFALWSPAGSYPTGMNFQTRENTAGKPAPRLVLHVDHQMGRNAAVFGANVHQRTGESFATALAREDSAASYGPLTLRLFFDGAPSTNCAEQRNAAANGRPSTISFKMDPALLAGGSQDTLLKAWLSCFTRPTQVTYYHEMEDNFTTAAQKTAWIAGWRHFSALVLAQPNRANLKRTIIYSDFTWAPSSGRNYLDWWPGDDAVDVFGADQYNFNESNASTADNQTEATHQAARPTYAAAVAHGKPYTVPEIGYDDPATRPAFLADLGNWLKDPSRNVTLVQYFDGGQDGVGVGNHQLLDQPSITAWRTVIHS